MARSKKTKAQAVETTASADESTKAKNGTSQAPQDTERPSSAAANKISEADAEAKKNGYVKDIEKRLAKVTKKQRQIETVEAKIAHLPDAEKETTNLINKDERAKINNKVQVTAQAKEYNDILQAFNSISFDEEKTRATEKSTQEAEEAQKIQAAKEEGKREGAEHQRYIMQTLLKFLRLAGYRRATPGGEPADNDAIEKVLVMVYSSEEAAFEAAENIAAGSDKVIDETDGITFGHIKEIQDNELALSGEAEHAEETSIPAAQDISVGAEAEVPAPMEGSTVIVTEKDLASPDVASQTPPPQTLTSDHANGGSTTAPAAAIVDDAATANAAAAITQPEPEQVDDSGMVKAPALAQAGEGWDDVPSGGDSWDNGAATAAAAAANNGGNWADESHDAAQSAGNFSAANDNNEGGFKEVGPRHGGQRGRGQFRGGNRGYRGDGGGYRGRGGFRGDRGDRGGYRPRGDRGDRGGYRPRGDREGGYRPRGDRGGWNRDQQQHGSETAAGAQ